MKNKGFTLIELMIVVAIIAIVAAIVFGSSVENDKRQEQITTINCYTTTEGVAGAIRYTGEGRLRTTVNGQSEIVSRDGNVFPVPAEWFCAPSNGGF